MSAGSFEEFKKLALAEGFDEVLERSWPANTVLDTHTHPFALKARMVHGEMWLMVDGSTRSLHAGDDFSLDRNVPHAERYGSDGATYWVARRN